MAPVMRLGSSALRSSFNLASRQTAFTAARCYSSKTQVRQSREAEDNSDIIR